MNTLSGDRPLTDPRDDQLGYAPFARNLAEAICKASPLEGFVIAIYGRWGLGKSTLLEFIEHYLQQMPDNDRPITVRFNPWWFSGHEDLTRHFFNQLQATIDSKWRKGARKVKAALATFSGVIASGAEATNIPMASKAAELAGTQLKKTKSVPELKKELADALREGNKKVLVAIDDIDRLTSEEITQVFRVVKAIADFPNVVYLLAFDKNVVAQALSRPPDLSGEEYLEKIVQLALELPSPDQFGLMQLLTAKLQNILGEWSDEIADQQRDRALFRGVEHFLVTPRDVSRLTNTLSVTYPLVRDEVNPADFVALEILRSNYSSIYEAIRNNPRRFTGASPVGIFRSVPENDPVANKGFYESLLNLASENDREVVMTLLRNLFPKLEAVWGGPQQDSSFEPRWSRQLRVCSSERFPVYFRLAIPSDTISNREMQEFLALTSDPDALMLRLISLAQERGSDGTSKVRRLLAMLENYTEKSIPMENIKPSIHALLGAWQYIVVADDLRGDFGFFSNPILVFRVVIQLVNRLEEPQRFEILRDACKASSCASMVSRLVVVLGQQHGKYQSNGEPSRQDCIVILEHLSQMEALALTKIREVREHSTLLDEAFLMHILYLWEQLAGIEEPKQWMEEITASDEGLLQLLVQFLSSEHSSNGQITMTRDRLDPERLKPYLDTEQIYARLQDIEQGYALTDEQVRAVRQFRKEYELRREGKNPDLFYF